MTDCARTAESSKLQVVPELTLVVLMINSILSLGALPKAMLVLVSYSSLLLSLYLFSYMLMYQDFILQKNLQNVRRCRNKRTQITVPYKVLTL